MNGKVDNYTLIEILMVLMLIAILSALGIGALNSLNSSGGISGTVRTLSAQISLGRSNAVSKNRFVAVLLPEAQISATGINNDTTNNFVSDLDRAKIFKQSRLCFVVADNDRFKFVKWVDNSRWIKWSKGILVYASDNFSQVTNVDNVTNKTSTAIVFANTGALTHSNIAHVQVFRARYNPKTYKLIYSTKERADSGWEISINPFTGRVSYEKKH